MRSVSGMNAELRRITSQNCEQREQLAVLGERLRSTEAALAASEAREARGQRAGQQTGEQNGEGNGGAAVRDEVENASGEEGRELALQSELERVREQLRSATDQLRQAKARLQLNAAESAVAVAKEKAGTESVAEELRESRARAGRLEGELRGARSEARRLAVENEALREQLCTSILSPSAEGMGEESPLVVDGREPLREGELEL